MKLIKKIIWYWRCFWGTRYFITIIEEGLKDDEILVCGHRIYLPENMKIRSKGEDENER